jgi:hypothetical protein
MLGECSTNKESCAKLELDITAQRLYLDRYTLAKRDVAHLQTRLNDEQALLATLEKMPDTESKIMWVKIDLGYTLCAVGSPDLAMPHLREALQYCLEHEGTKSRATAKCYKMLAIATRKLHQFEDSYEYARKSVKYYRMNVGKYNHRTLDAMHTLANSVMAMGNYPKSISVFKKIHHRLMKKSKGVECPFSAKVLHDMSFMTPDKCSLQHCALIIDHVEYAHIAIKAYQTLQGSGYEHCIADLKAHWEQLVRHISNNMMVVDYDPTVRFQVKDGLLTMYRLQ